VPSGPLSLRAKLGLPPVGVGGPLPGGMGPAVLRLPLPLSHVSGVSGVWAQPANADGPRERCRVVCTAAGRCMHAGSMRLATLPAAHLLPAAALSRSTWCWCGRWTTRWCRCTASSMGATLLRPAAATAAALVWTQRAWRSWAAACSPLCCGWQTAACTLSSWRGWTPCT
jgi:hypothetical protein